MVALDAKTGELKWVYGMNEGLRAAIAPRQLSGRGVSYWTDGNGDERILYITTGYRLVELNAQTGQPIESFGDHGMVDLKVGAYTGVIGQPGDYKQIDLTTGEIGLHTTPTVVNNIVIVGSSFKEGAQPLEQNNTKGIMRAFDVKTGKLLWTFHNIPQKGEFGYDSWENNSADFNGNTGIWTGITVDPELEQRLSAGRRSHQRLLWRRASGQRSVRRQPGVRRSHHRQDEMVLPDRASSDLGL